MIDEELLYKIVRENMKSLRQGGDSKLSQKQLGDFLGLKRSTVANLESGKQKLSIYNIYAMCAHLELELSDLLPPVSEVTDDGSDQAKILSTSSNKITPRIEKAISKMRKTD